MIDDATLGGYLRRHERAPAFGGSDGELYSVGIYVDESPDDRGRYGAALLFVRWSPHGDQPVGHVESDYLGFGGSEAEARKHLLALSLHDVKAELERAISRQQRAS